MRERVRDPARGAAHLYLEVPAALAADPGGWAETLAAELRIRGGRPPGARPLRSLLLGGAEPERLGPALPDLVRRILRLPPAGREGVPEWTVEVGDSRIPGETLAAWAEGGVTRVSLRGRASEPGAVRRAAAAGLQVDVQVDPGAGEDAGLGERIRALLRAGATSVSLDEPEGAGEEAPPASWAEALQLLRGEGWTLPELARGHRPGLPPRHPMAILRREPLLGLGPGAVSFRNPLRRWNQRDPATYLEAVRSGADPVAGTEHLDRDQVRLERSWLALRRARGIACPDPHAARSPTARWLALGWAWKSGARIVPALEGWARADALAVELAAHLDRRRARRPGLPGPEPGRPST